MANGHYTYQEITSQTQAWAQALELARDARLPQASDYDLVIFTGCGSTYYLSLAAASLYQELTGRSARAVPAGELLLNPRTVLGSGPARILLVAVSRSGTTTETRRAVERFKTEGVGHVIVVSNYDEMLSSLGDVNIVIPTGQERSIAQTRSFASMYVAVSAACARMAGRNDFLEAMLALPETGRRLVRDFESLARESGQDLAFDRFYFLGSGIRYGLACEASLKMKEMSLTHSEAFHFLEFRHGPKSMINAQAVVVGFLSDANLAHEQAVLNEIEALGGSALSLGEADATISFGSFVPEPVRGVLYLPVLQLLAYHRALAKDLDPDRPRNLASVVRLDL